jgi:hypothetical protein
MFSIGSKDPLGRDPSVARCWLSPEYGPTCVTGSTAVAPRLCQHKRPVDRHRNLCNCQYCGMRRLNCVSESRIITKMGEMVVGTGHVGVRGGIWMKCCQIWIINVSVLAVTQVAGRMLGVELGSSAEVPAHSRHVAAMRGACEHSRGTRLNELKWQLCYMDYVEISHSLSPCTRQ